MALEHIQVFSPQIFSLFCEKVVEPAILLIGPENKDIHCIKSVQIQSFFWSVFSHFWTEYRDLQSKSLYSVQKRENTDQKKLRIWTCFGQ